MYRVENKTLGCHFEVETLEEAQRYRDTHDMEDVTAKLLGSPDGKNDPTIVSSAGHHRAAFYTAILEQGPAWEPIENGPAIVRLLNPEK